MMNELHVAVATLTVRVLAGMLFAFQGYDKVFKTGMNSLQSAIRATLGEKRIPAGITRLIAFTTSWIELVCGVLLIVGLFTPWAIYLLCLDLIIVSAGFSYAKTMWDTNHVMFRLMLLIFLLLVPETQFCISLDTLIGIGTD